MNRRALQWFAAIWVICLIIASLQPFRPETTKGPHSYKHQVEHVVVFGATGIVLLAAMRRHTKAFVSVVSLAVFIETAQLLIYRMPAGFEWWDVRDDTLGAAAAILLARYFQSAVKTLNS